MRLALLAPLALLAIRTAHAGPAMVCQGQEAWQWNADGSVAAVAATIVQGADGGVYTIKSSADRDHRELAPFGAATAVTVKPSGAPTIPAPSTSSSAPRDAGPARSRSATYAYGVKINDRWFASAAVCKLRVGAPYTLGRR